jgi:hypothetical protein
MFMLKKIWLISLIVFALHSCASQNIPTSSTLAVQEETNTFVSPSVFLQDHGILYVRDEYHQAQMGLSIAIGGGEFRDLTTSHEWWIDTDNLQRTKRVTIEWLEDGPHLVGADGSDGSNRWWLIDITQNITQAVYHDGKNPFELSNLNDFLDIFSRDGKKLIEAVQRKEAKQVGEAQQGSWGKVISIRQTNPQTGQTITSTVRAEPPNILIERVVIDKDGNLFASDRITNWEWLDPVTLASDFWLSPPKDVPIGANKP